MLNMNAERKEARYSDVRINLEKSGVQEWRIFKTFSPISSSRKTATRKKSWANTPPKSQLDSSII